MFISKNPVILITTTTITITTTVKLTVLIGNEREEISYSGCVIMCSVKKVSNQP